MKRAVFSQQCVIEVLANRQLVALNAPGNVGSPSTPLDVLVDRDDLVVVAQQ